MNTLLALTLIASAYGFVVTILLLNKKALSKRYFNDYKRCVLDIEKLHNIQDNLMCDRDQLAQALKETQAKLDSIKVRRDPNTGRMVSAKKK